MHLHQTRNWENSFEEWKWFSEKPIQNITDSDYPLNFRWSSCKTLQGNTLICRFLQGIWFHTQREQILLAYGFPKETATAIMMLYKNTKVKVHSPDGDTDFFDIVAGVLPSDALAPYLFIICLEYVLWMSIDLIKEKLLQTQTIHSTSGKYTYPSWIPAASSGVGSRWYWSLCECRKMEHLF